MSEAQKIADTLATTLTGKDPGLHIQTCQRAVAELRRLDAVESKWAALSQDDGKAQLEIERLRAVNAQLLEFAREYLSNWGDLDGYLQDMARAAIAKTTGETK